MELAHSGVVPTSRVWSTLDRSRAFHQFGYLEHHYDGLAHTHAEYSILMCTSGALEVFRTDRRDVVQEGEILVVNPGERHRCRFGLDRAQSCGVTLIVRRSALRAVLETAGFRSSSPDCVFSGKVRNQEAFDLLPVLVREFEQQQPGYFTIVESIVPQILVHLLRSWPPKSIIPSELALEPQLPWLQMHRATEYMNSHGKAAFRFSDLCMDAGVSASRFIPLFKNSSGVSPHVYYNALLVFKARRLLQVGASTREAAIALGFRNVSHFCNLFHHVTGTTPRSDGPPIDGVLDLQISDH